MMTFMGIIEQRINELLQANKFIQIQHSKLHHDDGTTTGGASTAYHKIGGFSTHMSKLNLSTNKLHQSTNQLHAGMQHMGVHKAQISPNDAVAIKQQFNAESAGSGNSDNSDEEDDDDNDEKPMGIEEFKARVMNSGSKRNKK